MFHKILVATGGPPRSNQAMAYAIEMARDYTLQFLILHVVAEMPPYFVAAAGTPPERLLADSEAEGWRVLADASELATDAGMTFSTELGCWVGDLSPKWFASLHKSKNAI